MGRTSKLTKLFSWTSFDICPQILYIVLKNCYFLQPRIAGNSIIPRPGSWKIPLNVVLYVHAGAMAMWTIMILPCCLTWPMTHLRTILWTQPYQNTKPSLNTWPRKSRRFKLLLNMYRHNSPWINCCHGRGCKSIVNSQHTTVDCHDVLAQDCGIPSASALKIPQSCTKPLQCMGNDWHIKRLNSWYKHAIVNTFLFPWY